MSSSYAAASLDCETKRHVQVELIVTVLFMLTGYSSRFLSSSKLKPNLPWTR